MNKLEAAQERVRQRIEASAACALRIQTKIESGEYLLEDVPCFCGAKDDAVVDTKDRYGIPMTTVVCNNCALVRVNPRFTPETLSAFYNTDYRILNYPGYLTCDMSSDEEELAALYERQLVRGRSIAKLVAEQAIDAPKVVVDYGCHLGGVLAAFKEIHGCEVWGVEIDEASAAFARKAGVQVVPCIDELIKQGVKADLVIMQDVIEHFADLNDVRKVGEIMRPESFLYVYTPGLFRCNFHSNKQIAHTYYFCANTLNWTMVELGFAPTYIDEDCVSFWQYQGKSIRKVTRPQEWVEHEIAEIEGREIRKMPPFSGVCKFTKESLYANMISNFSKKVPDLYEITGSETGSATIIAGGPSISKEIDTIRALRQQGTKIISILRMYPWCVDHGIIPDYVVSLDCTDDQAVGFSKKVPGVTHLMAAVTNPSFFDIIAGEKVYIFDSRDDRKIQKLRRDAGYEWCTVINGGGSVAICSISLALNLGFRDLHVFGLDCMVSDVKVTHAEGIAGQSVQLRPLPIIIDGEEILTSGPFLEFANQALDLVSVAHAEKVLDSVRFYGDSLINKLWDGKFVGDEADVSIA